MRSTTIILVILLLSASNAFSTTYYIKDDGTGDYPTIQAGLTAATAGDIVLVADGVYSETSLDFAGKAVVLISENGPVNCSIRAGIGGGRLFLFGNSEGSGTVIDGFTIENGNSTFGGAVFIQGASPTFVNNIFYDNYASDNGGAVYMTSTSSFPTFINNIFDSNKADEGGAIYNNNAHPVMHNNTIVYNQASFGAGMRFDGLSSVDITDNIFWGNFPGGEVDGAISGTFRDNLIEGWSGGTLNFPGNPSFVTGPDGNRYLGSSSDARDAGGMPAADMCFTTGSGTLCMDFMTTSTSSDPDTGALDVGFHYGPLPRTINVPGDYATIQGALDAAYPGDTIQLQPMNYVGAGNRDLDFHGKAVTLRGDPDHTADATLACQGSAGDPHRGIHFKDGEGPGTVIEGLTIHGGYAADSGGGVFCEGSSPTLRDVEIIDCVAAVDGGGIACIDYSSPVIIRCSIASNDAGDDGGGLFARNFSSPDIDDSGFSFNTAGNRGGGALFVVNSFPTIDGSQFYFNTAARGGGLAFTYAYGPVTDCLITSNWASEAGGGVECYGNAQCVFTRCTFGENHAPEGVAVWCKNNSSPSFENTLITYNYLGSVVGRFSDDCNPTFACCDMFANSGGDWVGFIADNYLVNGNFAGDPYFCSTNPPGDYRLNDVSMCSAEQNPACGQIGVFGINCSLSPVEGELPLPVAASLVSCSPNPFNPSTKIVYELGAPGEVDLRIYDLAGRLVRVLKAGEVEPPGRGEAVWDGQDDRGRMVAAGVYVVRLVAGSVKDVLRVALVK